MATFIFVVTVLLCHCLSISVVHGQVISWLGGSRAVNAESVLSMPGGRSGAGAWQDANNTVWLFAGVGAGHPALLNDVWRFSQTWRQVHPGTVSNLTVATSRSPEIPPPRRLAAVCGAGHTMVVFGGLTQTDRALGDLWVFDITKRVWRKLVEKYADSANHSATEAESGVYGPQPRGDAASWCTNTHLYLFGGLDGSGGILRDMWRLRLSDLTWEEVKSSREAPAALRDHKTASYPEARSGAMTWWLSTLVSFSGPPETLYMFGGNILSQEPRTASGFTSDLWRYSVEADSWRFVTGSVFPGQPSVFASEGRSSLVSRGGRRRSVSTPGCRRGGAAWTDSSSKLWLFGGEGADWEPASDVVHPAKLLADLWRFDPNITEWRWMGGAQKHDSPAAPLPDKDQSVHPLLGGGRRDAATWTKADRRGLLLFGGFGLADGVKPSQAYLNDLWILDVSGTITYDFSLPAVYGFAVVFVGVALVLCLAVVALYARDRSQPAQWRQSAATRYRQLHDSDT